MTPSILAPLSAGPAQLSGANASDAASTVSAERDGATPFRELMAQENAQSDADSGDQAPDAPATRASADGQDEDAGASAENAGNPLASPDSRQPSTTLPGGQALPPVAATDGLVAIADTPTPRSPAPVGTATINDRITMPASSTRETGAASALATTPATTAYDSGSGTTHGAAATAAASAGLADRTALGGRNQAANIGDRDRSASSIAERAAPADARATSLAGSLADGRGREALPIDGARRLDGYASGSGLMNSAGDVESFSFSGTSLGTATAATPASAPAATPPPSAIGALAAAPATNPLSFSLEGTGTVSSNPTSFELTQPLGSQAWQQELGGRVHWMADARMGRAELRLNPPELGPLEVTLNIRGEEVSASFQAQHAATREAVEQALPRLREMLAQSGLQLTDTNVGQQGEQQHAAQDQQRGHEGRAPLPSVDAGDAGVGAVSAGLTLAGTNTGAGPGRLDLYA